MTERFSEGEAQAKSQGLEEISHQYQGNVDLNTFNIHCPTGVNKISTSSIIVRESIFWHCISATLVVVLVSTQDRSQGDTVTWSAES